MKHVLFLLLIVYTTTAYSSDLMQLTKQFCEENHCNAPNSSGYLTKGSCFRIYQKTDITKIHSQFYQNEFWLVLPENSYYRNSIERDKALQVSNGLYLKSKYKKISYLIYEAQPVLSLKQAERDYCLIVQNLENKENSLNPIALLVYKKNL